MIDLDLRLARDIFVLQLAQQLPGTGVTALFGPSGCGKTSLLRCLAGLERGTGRVALDGEVWQDDRAGVFVPTHRRSIGYVVQESALFPHLDVRGNLDYGLRRTPPSQRRIALDAAVGLLGIGHLMPRDPATLSGGERQRVAIARALATSPRLLLMDEPLAALDAARKREVLPYLEALHRELRLPVVYVSHSVDELARLADHLLLMESGRVVAAGGLMEMLARLDLPLQLGEDTGVVLDAVVAQRDAHWQLARLDVDQGRSAFWARDQGHAVGSAVRVRVLARDVSIAADRLVGSSIGNQLPGVVEAIAQDEHPGSALVRVRVEGIAVVARLTRRSAHALELVEGKPVWVQVKTVALVE